MQPVLCIRHLHGNGNALFPGYVQATVFAEAVDGLSRARRRQQALETNRGGRREIVLIHRTSRVLVQGFQIQLEFVVILVAVAQSQPVAVPVANQFGRQHFLPAIAALLQLEHRVVAMRAMFPAIREDAAVGPGISVQWGPFPTQAGTVCADPQSCLPTFEQVSTQGQKGLVRLVNCPGAQVEQFQGVVTILLRLAATQHSVEIGKPRGPLHQPGAQVAYGSIRRNRLEALGGTHLPEERWSRQGDIAPKQIVTDGRNRAIAHNHRDSRGVHTGNVGQEGLQLLP